MRHQTGSDFAARGFLQEPGTYHFCVIDCTEEVIDAKGAIVDNAAFRASLEVLAGTSPGQEKKTCDMLFFHPKPSDKNEGAFARKKIDRFLLAVGLIEENARDQGVDIDMTTAIGRQFVAKMEQDEKNPKYLRLSFADIFHVDDEAVKAIPKCGAMLRQIPVRLRRVGSTQSKPAPAKSGAMPSKPIPATPQRNTTSAEPIDPWDGGV